MSTAGTRINKLSPCALTTMSVGMEDRQEGEGHTRWEVTDAASGDLRGNPDESLRLAKGN